MKFLRSVLMALIVAIIGVAIWWVFRDAGRIERPAREVTEKKNPVGREVELTDSRPSAAEPSGFDWTKTVSGWIDGEGLPGGGAGRLVRGVPIAVRELAAMTRGLPSGSAGTIEIKRKVGEIAFALEDMSDAELEKVAEAFRESDDPGFKFQMLVAFQLRGKSPILVDAVADSYEAEPVLSGDVLQQIAARTPESDAAVRALEGLLARAIEPQERELLLSRLAIAGRSEASRALSTALDAPRGSSDRRVAVTALARLGDDASRARLRSILDGDFEETRYPPTVAEPADPKFRDLRAHAVNAMLISGRKDAVRELLDRVQTDADSPVSRYASALFGVVNDARFIPDVVDLALASGRLDDGFFAYLARQSKTEDIPQLERLRALDLSPARRRSIDEIIARSR